MTRRDRPGPALLALVAIVAITLAWWALALWPVSGAVPDWLARTRAACFGSSRGGLPDAGGWILLVGEPLGMLGVLMAVWGRSLRHDLGLVMACPRCRVAALGTATLLVAATGVLGARVALAAGLHAVPDDEWSGVAQRLDAPAPPFSLVDQLGRATSLADFRGRPVLLTFAYGHCTTVCPATVSDLRAARRQAGRADVPIVIVTLDPWRDTPDRLPMMAQMWALASHDRVLSGSVADVEHVLDAYAVFRQRDERTGDIAHTNTAYAVSAEGRLAWRLYGGAPAIARLIASLPPAR